MVLALTGARLFDGERFNDGAPAVLVEDGRIAGLVPEGDIPSGAEIEDLAGAILAPGFVDVQVNGGGGAMLNSERSVAALRTIAKAHRRFGTTTLLPTLITDTTAAMREAAEAVRAAIDASMPGIRGVHFEGPCMSPARAGVHPQELFRPFDAEMLGIVAGPGLGRVLLTLAPEIAGAEAIRALVKGGAVVSAGHTAASYEEAMAGVAAGITGFTHLFNAMSQLVGRKPGAVGAALDSPGTWCSLIVDGHHVHDASLRVAIAAKAPDRMMLITDAMATVGARDKRFVLHGVEIRAVEGRLALADGTLAGADLDMMSAVRNAHRRLGLPLEDALAMASRVPAEFLGLGGRIGRIGAGCDADLVAIDPGTLVVTRTWIGGQGEDA